MALNAYALLTTGTLRTYLGSGGTEEEERLESAINRATAIIENYLDRQLVSRGSQVEYHTVPAETSILYSLDWPLITVTSIYEDDTRAYASTELLTVTTDYIVSKPHGRIIRVASATGSQQAWSSDFRAIKLTCTAGYQVVYGTSVTSATNLPDDITDVALWLAATLFKETDRGTWGLSGMSDAVGNWTRLSAQHLTPQMREILDAHRRWNLTKTGERDS